MIGGCFQRNVAFEEDHEDRLWGKKNKPTNLEVILLNQSFIQSSSRLSKDRSNYFCPKSFYFSIGTSSQSSYDFLMVVADIREQFLVCVASGKIPLAKTSHMVRPRIKEQGMLLCPCKQWVQSKHSRKYSCKKKSMLLLVFL